MALADVLAVMALCMARTMKNTLALWGGMSQIRDRAVHGGLLISCHGCLEMERGVERGFALCSGVL